MIEVGKKYTLVMLDLTDEGYAKGSIGVTVTGREGNLIQVNGCEVINTASPLFHSLTDSEGQMAYFKKLHDNFEASMAVVDDDEDQDKSTETGRSAATGY